MICPNCKADVAGQASFCPECGWNLMEPIATAAQTTELVNDSAAKVEAEADAVEANVESVVVQTAEAVSAEADVESVVVPSAEEAVITETKSVLPDSVVYAPIVSEPVQAAAPVVAASPIVVDTGVKASKAPEKVIVPKEYKPLSTIGTMGFLLLTAIPVVGLIALFIYAFGGKNKNRKSLARAILIWLLIIILILAAAFVTSIFLFGWDNIEELLGGLVNATSGDDILDALQTFQDNVL